MSHMPDNISIERRRSGPWVAAALVGLAVAVACVLWMPGVFLYLVGLGLAALAAARVVFVLLDGRARVLGAIGITLILAAAILTPWQLAEAERSGSPRWTLKTDGIVDDLYVDGSRLLFSDDSGLHALDLTSGSILWSFDISRVYEFHVAADGHVLIRSALQDGEFVWLSPDGDLLWRSVADAHERYLMGLNFRAPLASSNGVLVVARCAEKPDGENEACTYVGIGPDGKKRWETAGYDGVTPEFEQQEAGSQYNDPERLPTVAVIDSRPDKGGEALVVNANDGATIEKVDVKVSLVVTRQTVVYESGPADSDGKCRSHGLSRDGKVDWSAETPCLHGSGIVLGDRLYGVVAKSGSRAGGGDRPIDDSFMIDAATGHWKMVGGLEQFNNHSDSRVGVPGADIVVQRHNQHLTGVDPDTGKVMWDVTAPGDDVPGVSSANGAAVVLASPDRGHNPFYAGDERQKGVTVLVIDTASGDVTGRTLHGIWDTLPAGPGQVILVDGEEVSLIGSDSDAR